MFRPMKPRLFLLPLVAFGLALGLPRAHAQTFASGNDKAAAQIESLSKKLDEQNLKLDALSQQLLKMEKQIEAIRPGVMIGESTPAPSAATSAAAAPSAAPNGNAHVVTKGETLTSIAKTYRVGVQELQKFNHIENDRALQIGQTISIPTSGATPAPSPTPAP